MCGRDIDGQRRPASLDRLASRDYDPRRLSSRLTVLRMKDARRVPPIYLTAWLARLSLVSGAGSSEGTREPARATETSHLGGSGIP